MPTNSGKNSGFNLNISRYLLLTTLFLASLSGLAQIDIQRYTTATDTFYWKRYTQIPKPPRVNLRRFLVSQPSKKIDAFLEKYLAQALQVSGDSASPVSIAELKKSLYPIDVNGDRLPDMIFSGTLGGAPEMVRIWINRKDSFELIFEDYQYISKFRKEGDKLTELQTADVGKDGDYLYFTRDYRVQMEQGVPGFVKGKQTVSYQHMEEPANYYPVPIPFIAKADTMLLRASAAQQNEPFNPGLDTFGNIMAKYRTKARGVALAFKSMGKGNDWFFIEVSPSASPSASVFYDLDKLPTFIRGWVSGQAVQLVP